jgi:hypothetical protein
MSSATAYEKRLNAPNPTAGRFADSASMASNRSTSGFFAPPRVERALHDRAAELSKWLASNGCDCQATQAHLDAGSVEHTYWHYGYLAALRDVLRLIDSQQTDLH